MAQADGHDGNARTTEFEFGLAGHGFGGDGDPRHVRVNVSADANNCLVAIIKAGSYGRWSIDFRVASGSVEVTRAYEEGMRIDEDELPAWMEPVKEQIEQRVLN